MKYQCGPFIYDLPKTSCVFCQNADIYWDYSGGMYLILCPYHKIEEKIWIKGCDDKRKPYPENTEFTSEEYKMRNVLNRNRRDNDCNPCIK